MLVGGAILPHPPIILPSYAGRRGPEVDQTIQAVQRACRWVADVLRPDRIVISSPHRAHGFDVPLHFVREALGALPPLERVLTHDPSYAAYRTLGEELRRREIERSDRVALIASGDCSHCLTHDAPEPYDPRGAELDRAIVAGVKAGDARALLGIDPLVVQRGLECGLRSFIFALSALHPAETDILSYEAPYGVGYLVATLTPRQPPGPGG